MESKPDYSLVLLLQVYVASHCANCIEAQRLAQLVAQMFPDLVVEVIDLDWTTADSADVFSVPTYVLNDKVCFLGNPSLEELCALLRQRIEVGLVTQRHDALPSAPE